MQILCNIIDAQVANTTSLVDLKLLYTDTYTISNAYPNPFNPSTSFSITMNESEKVRVSVYNVLGKEINVIHNGPLDIGSHNFVWDANNLSSGAYYLRTISKTTSYSQKLVLIK